MAMLYSELSICNCKMVCHCNVLWTNYYFRYHYHCHYNQPFTTSIETATFTTTTRHHYHHHHYYYHTTTTTATTALILLLLQLLLLLLLPLQRSRVEKETGLEEKVALNSYEKDMCCGFLRFASCMIWVLVDFVPVCESKILIFSFIELTSVSRLHFYGRYHHSKKISFCKVALRGYEPDDEFLDHQRQRFQISIQNAVQTQNLPMCILSVRKWVTPLGHVQGSRSQCSVVFAKLCSKKSLCSERLKW